MKAQRWAVIAAGSAAIVGVGIINAPREVTVPVDDAEAAGNTSPAPSESVVSTPGTGGLAGLDLAISGTFDGPAVTNPRGTYQAQLVIDQGLVVDVVALQAGTDAPESLAVNQAAIPVLRDRVLVAQSAQVDAVSGASFTSPAFIESVEGAFAAAAASVEESTSP